MTNTDTTTKKTGKRAGAASKPVDSKAFLGMLTDAKKLLNEFQRALKQVSPKLSMRDYMALARINAGASASADADANANGQTATGKKQVKVRQGVTSSLQTAGLVTTTEGSNPEVTDQGRRVLADMDELLASIVGKMKGKKGAATKAGGRNVPMALKAVKQSTRAGKGAGEQRAGGRKRAERKNVAAGDTSAGTQERDIPQI